MQGVQLGSGWRFGAYQPGSERPEFDDSGYQLVTVPHCAVPLGWRDWDPRDWEKLWTYRRQVDLPGPASEGRWVLEFAGVLTGCTVWLNGDHLVTHLGGYLPFQVELTGHAKAGANLLAVVVDGRWLNVPPQGRPGGATTVDFFEPAGIYREVTLKYLPPVSVEDLFVVGLDVLGPGRRVEVRCSVAGLERLQSTAVLRARVCDGPATLSEEQVPLGQAGEAGEVRTVLAGLERLCLWDVDQPALYDLEVSVETGGRALHTVRRRFGLREARFSLDGFYLNGRRLQLRGLNRHQLFPFRGMAMPARAQRKDAELLKYVLHCNMARCSHYPQSPAFLDACDELGLLVWEEVPGWGYVGDANWQRYLLRDVADMVRRDRSRPSVVIWGVRANESPDARRLYEEARRIAYELDGTRPTSGSTLEHDRDDWDQDVFAFDDYCTTENGAPSLRPPVAGVPYLVTEAVGALSGHAYYRRDDPQKVQQDQALLHASVMDKGLSDRRYCGVLGWCAIDYASANGRTWRHMKWPGALDTFRVPKPGAAIYRSQVPVPREVVIEPAFYWYFGEGCSVRELAEAMICSNCEELRVWLDGAEYAWLLPDRQRFSNLEWPPFFLPLSRLPLAGCEQSELTIEGYVGGQLVLSRRLSADVRYDRLSVEADDSEIEADGVDATRVVVRVTDRYGSTRPKAQGAVRVSLDGPGELIGESLSPMEDGGPVRALWVRSHPGEPGLLRLAASHPSYEPVELAIVAR